MNKFLPLLLLVVPVVGCARVTLRYEEDGERRHITLPFSALEAALRFSDEGRLEIEDLAGISEEIDLVALAQAFRTEEGRKSRVEMQSDGMQLQASVVGKAFRVDMREDDGDQHVTLNLPLMVLDVLADADAAGAETLSTQKILRAFKKQKGVLLSVVDEDSRIEVVIK